MSHGGQSAGSLSLGSSTDLSIRFTQLSSGQESSDQFVRVCPRVMFPAFPASILSFLTQEVAVGSVALFARGLPLRAPLLWSLTSMGSRPARPWGAYRVTSEGRVTWRLWWMCRQRRA